MIDQRIPMPARRTLEMLNAVADKAVAMHGELIDTLPGGWTVHKTSRGFEVREQGETVYIDKCEDEAYRYASLNSGK